MQNKENKKCITILLEKLNDNKIEKPIKFCTAIRKMSILNAIK